MQPADLLRFIRDVPDFPKPGIVFKDITPLLADPGALRAAIDLLAEPWRGAGITHVAGIESRGFILAPSLALSLGTGFIPLRKPGKLPWTVHRQDYALEYGHDALELHTDAAGPGDRVLVVDDVLATGGTALAAHALIHRTGATVAGTTVLVQLDALGGAARLTGPTHAVLHY